MMSNEQKKNELVIAAGADVMKLRQIIEVLWGELSHSQEVVALHDLQHLANDLEVWG